MAGSITHKRPHRLTLYNITDDMDIEIRYSIGNHVRHKNIGHISPLERTAITA